MSNSLILSFHRSAGLLAHSATFGDRGDNSHRRISCLSAVEGCAKCSYCFPQALQPFVCHSFPHEPFCPHLWCRNAQLYARDFGRSTQEEHSEASQNSAKYHNNAFHQPASGLPTPSRNDRDRATFSMGRITPKQSKWSPTCKIYHRSNSSF